MTVQKNRKTSGPGKKKDKKKEENACSLKYRGRAKKRRERLGSVSPCVAKGAFDRRGRTLNGTFDLPVRTILIKFSKIETLSEWGAVMR